MKMALTALVVVLVSSHAAYGQMAKWAMRPGYDSIRLAAGVPVILTDSAGTTSLWSTDARLLASTTDSVAPFSNGFAVVLKKGTTDITGFYATDGTFTKLQGCKAVYGCPYFRDGYLLVDTLHEPVVELVTADGIRTDDFDAAQRGGGLGSGTYAFEPIAPGSQLVSWDDSFGFDLTAYQLESEIPWQQQASSSSTLAARR